MNYFCYIIWHIQRIYRPFNLPVNSLPTLFFFLSTTGVKFCYQIHPVTRSDRKSNNTWAAWMRKCKLQLLTGFIADDRVDNVSFRDLRLPAIARSSDNALWRVFCCMQLEHAPFKSKHDSVFIIAASQVAIYVQTFSCFSPFMVCMMCCYYTIFLLFI